VVLTTHSMEEVEALASRVGVIASRMLGAYIYMCRAQLNPLAKSAC
jgi:ABC-type multidrug transport system ATPase subunit